MFGKPLHRINSLIGGLADQVPRHKNIRSHAICLNLHGAAQIAAIHGVVCYAVTNQIAVKSEVGDLMCNAEPPTNSGVAAKIGRASCRERVCQYVSISVAAVYLKNQQTKFRIKKMIMNIM